MTKISPAFAVSAVAGGIAALVTIFAVVPATQADTGWKMRTSQPAGVMAFFDTNNDLVRFYVGGKEVAILNGSGIQVSHPDGR